MRTIILGTDWWTDCDDVAALRIVCRMAKQNVWRIAGVILNACMEYSARSIDTFIRLEGAELPIGIDLNATDFGGKPPYQKKLSDMGVSSLDNKECEDACKLYRKILASMPDNSVELVEIGYCQVVSAVLDSESDEISELTGIELLSRKVKMLWMMAGNWEAEKGRENNFARNRRTSEAASRLLEKYPGEICFLGYEVGKDVITRPSENDYLLEAFRDHGSQNGRSSWDPMLTVLAAECPNATDEEIMLAGYSTVRGFASVCPETGENSFTESADGKHRYVKKLFCDSYYEEKINSLIS